MIAPNASYDGAIALRLCPTPCKPDCPDRHGGCQVSCERYAEWKPRYDATMKEIKAKYDGSRNMAAMISEKQNNPRYRRAKEAGKRGDRKGNLK